jgi:hypothetical protein
MRCSKLTSTSFRNQTGLARDPVKPQTSFKLVLGCTSILLKILIQRLKNTANPTPWSDPEVELFLYIDHQSFFAPPNFFYNKIWAGLSDLIFYIF